MKLKSKIAGVALLVVLMMSVNTTVFADPTIDSLNQQKQQLENQKNQYNKNVNQNQLNADSAQKDIENINLQIEKLDSKIEGLNRTIKDTNIKISAKEADIQVAQKNIEKAEANIASEQELFGKRMRVMYMDGGLPQYISILLSSKNFSDLVTKAENISLIIKYDNKIIKNLSDNEEKLKAAQMDLKKDKDELLAYKQDNANKLAELKSNVQNQQQLVSEAKRRQAYYLSQISDYKNKIAAADKQVQDTIKQMQALALAQAKNNQQNNGVNIPATSNAIVAYAYTFLGCPYVWGAEGEIFTQADIDMYRNTNHDVSDMKSLIGKQAFDCSGLMQYVYAHFGIHIGRTTYEQINNGTPVDRSNLKPGDLILFGTYSDPHHVGMYVGNNCYIQAPYSGDVVRVSLLTDSDEYLCARRIMN